MSAVVRERVGWDLASAALFVVIVILAFTLPPRFPGSSWFLVATAVGIAAVYAFGARRYVSLREGPEPSPPVSWLLQAALIALLAIGTSIEPTMMLLQTIVLPLIWMTSRSTRQSILVTLLNAVALSIAYAASDGFSPGMLLAGIVTSGLSAAFSIALGLWITRIAEWGTERQRLLAELTAAQHGLEAASRESGAAAERARLAREVHDTIAQSLTSIVMLAERNAAGRLPRGHLPDRGCRARGAARSARARRRRVLGGRPLRVAGRSAATARRAVRSRDGPSGVGRGLTARRPERPPGRPPEMRAGGSRERAQACGQPAQRRSC